MTVRHLLLLGDSRKRISLAESAIGHPTCEWPILLVWLAFLPLGSPSCTRLFGRPGRTEC